MVSRTEPLVVNIFVTALAGVRLHKKLARNPLLAINLRGTGKEWAIGPIPFAVHILRRHGWILNAGTRLPTLADVVRAVTDGCDHGQADCRAHDSSSIRCRPSTPPQLV